MKITKTASGKTVIKMSKKDWINIGNKSNWLKKADQREYSYYPSFVTQNHADKTIEFENMDYEDQDGPDTIVIPAKFEVCPVCEGRGSYVNPSIDSHGISSEEFAEDPDFQEDYMGGVYDQTCKSCKGARVILVPQDPNSQEAQLLDALLKEEAQYRSEVAAEQGYMGYY